MRCLPRVALAAATLVLFPAALSAEPLLFEHATVIDMTGGKPRKNISVLVDGDRIVAVARKISAPRDALRISAKDKFLIPGLWDMHMHLGVPEAFFPLLLAHGVTGVREMFTGIPLPLIQQWRARPEARRI